MGVVLLRGERGRNMEDYEKFIEFLGTHLCEYITQLIFSPVGINVHLRRDINTIYSISYYIPKTRITTLDHNTDPITIEEFTFNSFVDKCLKTDFLKDFEKPNYDTIRLLLNWPSKPTSLL